MVTIQLISPWSETITTTRITLFQSWTHLYILFRLNTIVEQHFTLYVDFIIVKCITLACYASYPAQDISQKIATNFLTLQQKSYEKPNQLIDGGVT